MDSMYSTLSACSLLLSWLEEESMPDFPMDAFIGALRHDLQGLQVLLRHIISLKAAWQCGGPRIRRQQSTIYTGDLRRRLVKDLRRAQRLNDSAKTGVGAFAPYLYLADHFGESVQVAASLLEETTGTLRQLLEQIDSLPAQCEGYGSAGCDSSINCNPAVANQQNASTLNKCRPKLKLVTNTLEAKRIHITISRASPIVVTTPGRPPNLCSLGTAKSPPPLIRADSAISVDSGSP